MSILAFSLGISLVPTETEAALIPCARNEDDPTTSFDERKPCTVCHVVIGGQGLIKWGLGIMTVIAITVIFAMAVLYVISAGDEGLMGTAKGGMKAALIGFAVMLSAWLIINIVLWVLVDNTNTDKPLGGLVSEGTFKFSCSPASNVRNQ